MNDQTPLRTTETGGISADFNWVEKPLRQALADRPVHQSAVSLASMAIARWRDRQLQMQGNARKFVRLRKLLAGVTLLAGAIIMMIVWWATESIESLLQSASATTGASTSTAAAAVQQSASTTGTLTVLAAWTPTAVAALLLAGLLLVLLRLFSAETFNPARPAAWF